jgi:septum formation protein
MDHDDTNLDQNSPLQQKPLVLASRSPRRAEILQAVDWPFDIVAANIDETRLEDEDALAYVERLAKTKAATVAKKMAGRLVLGADTVVVIEGTILGQPKDKNDAGQMLKLLSGKWHEVLTGVALARVAANSVEVVEHEITRVRFAELSQAEIDWYVGTGEPMDKAGAYAIQGRAARFIEEIQGDYFNIVGLPIRLVYELLRRV